MIMVKTVFAALASLVLAAAAPPATDPPAATPAAPVRAYAEGQVWEYRTRRGESGSLLRIQKIETLPELAELGPVYHISVIGLNLAPNVLGTLQHVPVSRQTLDASVTRLSRKRADFPPAEAGIEEWRRAKGGVFTITVAQIAELLDRSTRGLPQD